VKDRDIEKHRQFEIELFRQTGFPAPIRLILSSYTFMDSGAQGFPDGKSDCSQFYGPDYLKQYCKSVPYQPAYDPTSEGYSVMDEQGQWMQGVYTRVHRDQQIISAMQNWLN
jgi:alpha-amylase